MAAHAVKLKVVPGVPKDCSFWLEDDGWNGVCEELFVTVRGSSFEDAKTRRSEHVSRPEIVVNHRIDSPNRISLI